MAKLNVIISAKIGGLVKGLQSAKKSLKGFGRFEGNVTKGLLTFGVGIVGVIAKLGMMSTKLIQTEIAFEVMLGSAEKAKQLITDLRNLADVTPFDDAQIIKSGRVLLGAGIKAEALIDTLRNLGDISSGSGKDLVELSSVFAKSFGKNKVQADELMQLIEAGIPIIKEFKKTLGDRDIFKMASEGKIKFKELESVFKSMTARGGIYFELMLKQSRTLGGRWSTLTGKMQKMGSDAGEPLQEALTSIVNTFIDWTAQANKMRGPLGLLIKDLTVIADLLEQTRDNSSFEKKTGLKGLSGTDVAVDTLANSSISAFGAELNPMVLIGKMLQFAGLGSQARGEELLKGIKEEMERMNTNIKGGIN